MESSVRTSTKPPFFSALKVYDCNVYVKPPLSSILNFLIPIKNKTNTDTFVNGYGGLFYLSALFAFFLRPAAISLYMMTSYEDFSMKLSKMTLFPQNYFP